MDDWSDATCTWTVTTGDAYASVSSDGIVTLTGNPTGNIVVRLGVSKGGYTNNNAATITLTRAAIAQGSTTEATITGPTISPASAALYKDDAQAFTASASASAVTTTVPAHITLTGDGNTYYYYSGTLYSSTDDFDSETSTPLDVTLAWTKTGSAASYLTFSTTSGSSTTVTHATQSPSDLTATITVTASASGASNQTASATVTAYGPMVAPTITRTGNTITLATTSVGATIYYTTDGTTTPSAINGTLYTAPFDLTTSPTTVKAIAIRDGRESTVTTSEAYQITLPAPVITISNTGLATITAEYGAEIHYTTDGSTPTDGSAPYSGAVPLSSMQTIKAIAVKSGFVTSAVAEDLYVTTCITSSTVIIDDREDHTWTYYSDKPDDDYPNALRSPNPRNVKITYRGGSVEGASAVAVSATESQNEFVYYKTIERYAWGNSEGKWLTGEYAYQVIPNPFSKRPKKNTTYYGFGGWKIISGGEYINGYNDGATLPLEQKINLVNLDNNYTPNCISAEIVFEATWVTASVATATGNVTGAPAGLSGSTYETNFIVFTNGGNKTVTNMTVPVTVSNQYPDGMSAGTSTVTTFTNNANSVKLEYVKIGDGTTPTHPISPTTVSSTGVGTGTFTASGAGWLIVGRGCTGTVNYVTSSGTGRQYNYRIESGKYQFMTPLTDCGSSSNAANYARIVFGCDYDRAADDGIAGNGTGDNTKLRIVNYITRSTSGTYGSGNSEAADITVKSGYYGFSANHDIYTGGGCADGYGLGIGGNTDGVDDNYDYTALGPDNTNTVTYRLNKAVEANHTWERTMSFYAGATRNGTKEGVCRMLVEGGEFCNINGGGATPGSADAIGFHFRMRGGWVKGAIYGTASISNSTGSRKLVFTGGEVNGWVAGGCNGTDFGAGQGYNTGTCYIYAGGNTEFRSHDGEGHYNNAYGLVFNVQGGQIFGAGRGLAPDNGHHNDNQHYCGSTTTAYVVVADESEVEQNVYGGGYNGVSQNSHIYITGGTVGKKVFGGTARAVSTDGTWRCNNTDIRMYGGTVKGGIYGGHDETGVQFGNASVAIYGGTIGDEAALTDASKRAFVHGGGFGQLTVTQGDVNMTIGDAQPGATIYGDVYGGSALGQVNATATFTISSYATTPLTITVANPAYNNNKVTNVTLNSGTIYGSLYGGALGQKNGVNGATSDIAANVYGPVHVVVNGGSVIKPAGNPGGVFGANNLNGAPQRSVVVDIYGTDPAPDASHYALNAVYGGGNMADYINTDYPTVTVHNCDNSIGGVYGGGNAAAVRQTLVTVYGGNKIGQVFGGGNGTEAAADVTVGGTTVNIHGGTIEQVFGGSNTAGTITGDIAVTLNKEGDTDPEGTSTPCDMKVGEVYGGGNQANSQAGTITIGCTGTLTTQAASPSEVGHTLEGIGDVYGGARMADITSGDITLNMYSGMVNRVFGGNNISGSIAEDITVNINKNNGAGCASDWYCGEVYGGGNMAHYSGTPAVNIINGTVERDVYGGGNNITVNGEGVAGGNVTMTGGLVKGNVFGGCNTKGTVKGTTSVAISAGTVNGSVFGGGLGSGTSVTGKATVTLSGTAHVDTDVYGGGSQGTVLGGTQVTIEE